ncbi:MAG: hypothetical protein HKM89_11425 [Gemmatimonadales bacterium]|nr:hypothetical protein [Gemmatimonadales bacterium]
MFYALLAIVAIVAIGAFVISRVEGLTFFAPKSSKRLTSSVEGFCVGDCRTADGSCPLHVERDDCPLWRFVEADVSTHPFGSPFATRQTAG